MGRGISFRFLLPSYPAMSDLLDSLLVASVVEDSSSDEDSEAEVVCGDVAPNEALDKLLVDVDAIEEPAVQEGAEQRGSESVADAVNRIIQKAVRVQEERRQKKSRAPIDLLTKGCIIYHFENISKV